MKHKRKNWLLRFLIYILSFLIAIFLVFSIWYYFDTQIQVPRGDKVLFDKLKREKIDDNHYRIGNNWLKKNDYGLWEMYLEGSAFERGVVSGKLTKELIYKQEEAFVEQIKKIVPSESYLKFLKYFIKFFNRDIDEYIIKEYQEEIYGISLSASDEFDFIGSKYERMLNYHAAHDIGHALQDLMLVGCTSFATNLGYTDSSLIIGRNFDFYINDAFAEDKIVCFEKPDYGYPFAYISWASMIGVVSGMNNKGLTVTINAGKSGIPTKAATPISLLAREILQYAANIDDALEIAKKRQTFVAESLLIGSAQDNNAVIIEKSPSKLGVYNTSNNFLVCSNHFQSNVYANDDENKEQILESTSTYRQNRTSELITSKDTVNYLDAASILRDRAGIDNTNIGIGNEKSLAQMISHHSIIFEPQKRDLWISTNPYQLGNYLNYNLDHFFDSTAQYPTNNSYNVSYTIPADTFLYSKDYENFKRYKKEKVRVLESTQKGFKLDNEYIGNFIELNPEYFEAYVLAGDYYLSQKNNKQALKFYTYSTSKEFEKNSQLKEVRKKIQKLKQQ